MATFFITSSLMVIAVLAARFLLKNKLSFLILYPLWAIVLLRLLIPVTFIESKTSIMHFIYTLNNKETSSPAIKNTKKTFEEKLQNNNSNIQVSNNQINITNKINNKPEVKKNKNTNTSIISKKAKNQKPEEKKIPAKKTVNKTPSSPGNLYKFLTKSAIIAWIAGSIIFFAIIIISNTIFYKKLQKSRKHIYTNISGINVFISGIINTPCIAGILKPSVYLPAYNNKDYLNHNNTYSTNNEYLKQILAHEYTHIKHKDNIWSLMRIICLCIYWFDPFVWAAAFYSKQDAELACDEAVLKNCTTDEKYNYGKMLLTISIKQKQSSLHLTTSMAGSKNNLKERIIMLSNNKKRFKKYHAILAALITIILAGCGMTKEKTPIKNTTAGNIINTVNKTEQTKASVEEVNNKNLSNNYDKYQIEKIFQDFINNGIKLRPEWRKWKGNTKNLYFSIQYATGNTPCLLVTTDVITDTNETINAFVYYYDTKQKNIELLTYLASNGTADPVKIKDGKFIITTHHSLRCYYWDGNSNEISADEVYGYFMDKENYTYSLFKWEVPFYNKKTSFDARKSYSKDKIDTYAYKTATEQNFPKIKADYIYKTYSDANPVPFYKNTEESWNNFYNNGSFKTNIHRITLHGCNNNEVNDNDSIIMDIVSKLSPDDFIMAEENSSILINNASARLHYSGKFSDKEVLYFLNSGYTMRAFILRTGKPENASYDVYMLDTSHWNKKDVQRDKESLDVSPEIFLQLRKSKLARADFDNDGKTEIAFYITENPYTLNGYKTFYIFDPEFYENGYKEYKLYSYTKDNYRYFTEQVLTNFDNYENQNLNKQTKAPDFFGNIKKQPDSNSSYKSKKNTLPGDILNDYNYIITDKNYKNNYEFGSQNNYYITLEDDKTEIRTSIGINYNKKGEKQKHNIEISAVLQYKGNGKFILKSPYSFKSMD